jgi:hypothetical protein
MKGLKFTTLIYSNFQLTKVMKVSMQCLEKVYVGENSFAKWLLNKIKFQS